MDTKELIEHTQNMLELCKNRALDIEQTNTVIAITERVLATLGTTTEINSMLRKEIILLEQKIQILTTASN